MMFDEKKEIGERGWKRIQELAGYRVRIKRELRRRGIAFDKNWDTETLEDARDGI